jgi:hypothetical protein
MTKQENLPHYKIAYKRKSRWISLKMETLIKAEDFEGDCKKGTNEFEKENKF